MYQLSGINETQTDLEAEQKGVEELKALFQPAGDAAPAGVATKVKSGEKPAYFDRFRGKVKIFLN